MASDAAAGSRAELFDSAVTVPSDSENYSANNEMTSTQSESPSSSSGAPMILYQPPSVWGLLRGAAINLILPFVNGLMLGFGELFAHEAAFRLGWSNTKIFPTYRRAHPVGPGVEIRELPSDRRRTLKDTASLE
ncbi:uncharacterized protein N7469_002754 [Penicillium citrinum]|uniref:Mitochondrial import protein 1 n=2 Tax=Penicillium TaxID=5073 RepID=A0A9W9TUJ4_PENCI|nr:uncharacterized protein N7469_002754 [Penicillium citrinum]KAJ5241163.1 hypothetical protein N7469_002754 [Penicillium citrinum]KAJ5586162.1 hypothetical protein N7450_005949 [Penicillium hetheringtonii]